MESLWKTAARAFLRRAEALQVQLDWVRDGECAMRDESLDEPFDDWESAARHWHEKMRKAEHERDEMKVSLEKNRAHAWSMSDVAEQTIRERDNARKELERSVLREQRATRERDELLQKLEGLQATNDDALLELAKMTATCDGVLSQLKRRSAQPSGNPGEFSERDFVTRQSVNVAKREHAEQLYSQFADLAARIAEAGEKHPRDLPDGTWAARYNSESNLHAAREDLRREPTWVHALVCEFHEAMVELARGDMERLVDELTDVATVAMRWRRAVMERAK